MNKYTLLLFSVLLLTSLHGQNITFAKADPQPELLDVYGGTLSSGDVDDDGDADVIVSGEDADRVPTFSLYLNDGDGNFTKDPDTNFLQFNADDIKAGDVDNDGDIDFLAQGSAGADGPKTTLYLNDGSGQFTASNTANFREVFAGDHQLVDLDGDEDLDVVFTGSADGGVISGIRNIIYENLGNNEFVPTDTLGGEYIAASVADDFNGDGRPDVIIQGFVDRTNVYWNTTTTTSVEGPAQEGRLLLFPNPSTGQFTLQLAETMTPQQLRIFASDGRLVYRAVNLIGPSHQMALALQPGLYLVTLSTTAGDLTRRLVITN